MNSFVVKYQPYLERTKASKSMTYTKVWSETLSHLGYPALIFVGLYTAMTYAMNPMGSTNNITKAIKEFYMKADYLIK